MSTLKLQVATNDVYCFRKYLLQKGRNYPVAVLFAVRHRIDLTLADAQYEVLAEDANGPTLVRIHADSVPATVVVQAPTFKPGWWPDEWKVRDRSATANVTGEMVVRRIRKDVFHASLGLLRFSAKPVFDLLPGSPGDPSLLATLWPTALDVGLDYVLTPVGLALEGMLVHGAASKDLLLLPRGLADASSDLAWPPYGPSSADPLNTWLWNQLPPADWLPPLVKDVGGTAVTDRRASKVGATPANNQRELVHALAPDAPEGNAWPLNQDRWAILRWHILTPVSQPVLDACFGFGGGTNGFYSAVQVQRLPNAIDLPDRPALEDKAFDAVHGVVVTQFGVTTASGYKPVFNHRGGVCSANTPVAATLHWSIGGSSSVLTSRTSRASWIADSDKLLQRRHTVLRTVSPTLPPISKVTENESSPNPPSSPAPGSSCFLLRRIAILLRWIGGLFAPTARRRDRARSIAHRHAVDSSPVVKSIAANPARDDLVLTWSRLSHPDARSLDLPSSDLHYAGLADLQGNATSRADVRPGWMAICEGFLQLAHSAYGGKASSDVAEELLKSTADTSQVFRGGLPLDLLGGPPGLSAWIVGGSSSASNGDALTPGSSMPSVVLRLDLQNVQVTASAPVLLWRTPAWWAEPVAATRTSPRPRDAAEATRPEDATAAPNWLALEPSAEDAFSPAMSSLAAGFASTFSSRPSNPQASAAQLAKALEKVFAQTLWVGQVGERDPGSWKLKVSNARATLTIPPTRLAGITAWSGFQDAYLVRTLSSAVGLTDGPLLDPFRGLFPLRSKRTSVPPIVLDVADGSLPAMAKPLFPDPGIEPVGWDTLQAPGFHPNIGGLSYDPRTRRFAQCHAGQIRYDALLRALPDGTIGSEAAAVPMNWVQARDDQAIAWFDRNDSTSRMRAHGWLPNPLHLDVRRADLKLGGLEPRIQWAVEQTGASTASFKVNISSEADEFDPPAGLAATEAVGGVTVKLVPDAGAPMVNLGLPLLALPGSQRMLDGEGRVWSLFTDGLRVSTDLDGTHEERRRTAAISATIGIGSLQPDALTVSVLDHIDDGVDHPTWDLAGALVDDAGGAPFIGPYELMHAALVEHGRNRARIKARLAPPTFSSAARRSSHAGGEVDLAWGPALQGSALQLVQEGTFDWKLDEALRVDGLATEAAPRSVARVAGSVRNAGNDIRLSVSHVALETAMGRIQIACQDGPIEHVLGDDGRLEGLRFSVAARPHEGVVTELHLTCRPDAQGHREWVMAADVAPTIRWLSVDGKPGLVLDLLTSELRFDQPLFNFGVTTPGKLSLAQSSDTEWMVQASLDGMELAGLLQKSTADDSATTQVRLRYRALTVLTDLKSLFGPCRTGPDASLVRADVEAYWQSAKAGDAAATGTGARLTGRLLLENDYRLATDAGTTFTGAVEVYFAEAPFDISASGELVPGSFLDVLARYTWTVPDGERALGFQFPQRLNIERSPNGKTTTALTAAALVLLRASRLAMSEHYELQLLCEGGASATRLGVRAAPRTSSGMEGWLVRVPLRTEGQALVLKVPAGSHQQMSWFPVADNPYVEGTDPAAFWYETRALAKVLGREALGAQCADRLAPTFAGKPLPAVGDRLEDWTGLDGITASRLWLDSASLPDGGGAWATPYYAGVAPMEDAPDQVVKQGDVPQALRVTLLVPDPGAVGGSKSLAQALISDLGAPPEGATTSDHIQGILAGWARSEMRRRSCLSAALVAVHGYPRLNCLVSRSYAAFAVLPSAHQRSLPPLVKQAAYGALLDLLDASEGPEPIQPIRRFVATTDADSVLELADGLPRVDRAEAATEYRILTRDLLTDGGALAPGSRGSGVLRQQSMRFAVEDGAARPVSAMPVLDEEAPQQGTITPVVLDAVMWSARAGESLGIRWSAARSAAMAGPGVSAQLRAPRPHQMERALDPDHLVAKPLAVNFVASANNGRVHWSLSEIVSRARLGSRYREPISKIMLTTLVTPRETLHFTAPSTPTDYRAPGAIQLPMRIDSSANRAALLEPISSGTFLGGVWIEENHIAANARRAIGLIARRAITDTGQPQFISTSSVVSSDDITSGAGSAKSWNEANPPLAVVLASTWTDIGEASQDADLARKDRYRPNAGEDLKALMRSTAFKRTVDGATALHWMYEGTDSASAACIALFFTIPADPSRMRFVPLYFLRWNETMVTDQPERMLVVRDKRVVGFSSPGGPVTIELADNADSFECLRTSYALSPGMDAGRTFAWRFAPSGACLSRATNS